MQRHPAVALVSSDAQIGDELQTVVHLSIRNDRVDIAGALQQFDAAEPLAPCMYVLELDDGPFTRPEDVERAALSITAADWDVRISVPDKYVHPERVGAAGPPWDLREVRDALTKRAADAEAAMWERIHEIAMRD
jgi:hypothetical protein